MQFWFSVGRYRPVLLVGGFWLVLICLAAVAYTRLMSAGTPPEPLAAPSAEAQTQTPDPLEEDTRGLGPEAFAGISRVSGNAPDAAIAAMPIDIAPAGRPDGQLVPTWSLGLLVGLCALGCFGVSTGVRASRQRSKRRAALKPKAIGQRPKPVSKSRLPAQPAQPKRLSPYSPERDSVLIPEIARRSQR
ncbi:hypothetical protein C7271_18615, partial [filamentous cyanobacterium CCP5]